MVVVEIVGRDGERSRIDLSGGHGVDVRSARAVANNPTSRATTTASSQSAAGIRDPQPPLHQFSTWRCNVASAFVSLMSVTSHAHETTRPRYRSRTLAGSSRFVVLRLVINDFEASKPLGSRRVDP